MNLDMESSINSAIQKGFFQQIRYLLDFGLNVNERDDDRKTPLMNCALIEEESWGVGIARMLLEYGASSRLKDNRGLNAFHYACLYEKINLMKVYLTAIDFDLNATDRLGNTPLHYVVATGNEELLRTLVDALIRYKLPVDAINKKGDTPLIHAYKTQNITCGDLLLELGQADSSLQDSVDCKSASEWRHDAIVQLEESTCVKRPRTALARLQHGPSSSAAATRQLGVFQRLTRVPSAPTLRKYRSNNSVDKENDNEKIIHKNVLTAKLFRSASTSDLRNKPEYILNVSPLTYFTAGNQYRVASKQGHFVQQEDGSWRFEMKSLYRKFDFQFTNSYRKGAKPNENSGLNPMRALSPNCSEFGTDKNQKVGRRSSVKSPTNSELGRRSRIGSANPRNRRASMLSASSSSKSQLTTTDSSSSESVNSVTRQQQQQQQHQHQKKKSREEVKDDLSDVSSHSSKSDKAKATEPARPQSRATHHPKEPPLTNNQLHSIKE